MPSVVPWERLHYLRCADEGLKFRSVWNWLAWGGMVVGVSASISARVCGPVLHSALPAALPQPSAALLGQRCHRTQRACLSHHPFLSFQPGLTVSFSKTDTSLFPLSLPAMPSNSSSFFFFRPHVLFRAY